MNYHALLTYLSEVPYGRWEQFKQAVYAVQSGQDDKQAGGVARILAALSHVEFAWEPEDRWATCPPTLVEVPRRDIAAAVLSGQRPPSLIEQLCREARAEGIACEEHSQSDGPQVIRLVAPPDANLMGIAQRLGIAFAQDAAEALAACVPTVAAVIETSTLCLAPAIPPAEYFDVGRREWVPAERIMHDGVYRFEGFGPEYRLIKEGACRKVSREVGVYAVLDRSYWQYDHESHTLAIPPRLLPPPLVQRVLVLCSGFLAHYDGTKHRWIYRDVPPAIAHLLATKLGQTLEARC